MSVEGAPWLDRSEREAEERGVLAVPDDRDAAHGPAVQPSDQESGRIRDEERVAVGVTGVPSLVGRPLRHEPHVGRALC